MSSNDFIQSIHEHPIFAKVTPETITFIDSTIFVAAIDNTLNLSTPSTKTTTTYSFPSKITSISISPTSDYLSIIAKSAYIIEIPLQLTNTTILKPRELKVIEPVSMIFQPFSNSVVILDSRSQIHIQDLAENQTQKTIQLPSEIPISMIQIPQFNPENAWLSTALLASNSQHIYYISPILPQEFIIPTDWIHQTTQKTIANWSKKTEDYCYWSLEFLDSLNSQQQPCQSYTYPLPNLPQSYHKFDQLLKPNTKFAIVQLGSCLLVVTACQKTVKIFASLDFLVPTFKLQKSPPNLSLILVQELVLPSKITSIITNHNVPQTIFAISDKTVHQLQFKNEDDVDNLEILTKKIIDSSEFVGNFIIFTKDYDILYSFTTGNRLIINQLFTLYKRTSNPIKQSKSIQNNDWKPFQHNLKPRKLTPTNLDFTYPKLDENSVEIALSEFNTTTLDLEHLGENIQCLQQHSTNLERELQVQNQQTIDLSLKLKKVQDVWVEQLKRIDATRQIVLETKKKLITVLELLFDLSQPRLSSQELKYYQELSQLSLTIQDYEQKVGSLVLGLIGA